MSLYVPSTPAWNVWRFIFLVKSTLPVRTFVFRCE